MFELFFIFIMLWISCKKIEKILKEPRHKLKIRKANFHFVKSKLIFGIKKVWKTKSSGSRHAKKKGIDKIQNHFDDMPYLKNESNKITKGLFYLSWLLDDFFLSKNFLNKIYDAFLIFRRQSAMKFGNSWCVWATGVTLASFVINRSNRAIIYIGIFAHCICWKSITAPNAAKSSRVRIV